jgi:hypothetical protein
VNPRSLAKTISSILEWLLTVFAVGLALWILETTIKAARVGWVAIPVADDWDRWTYYTLDHYSLKWFFQQHVDHRLAAPRVLFAIDHLVFHGRGWFLIICSYCVQALTWILLWRLSARICRQDFTERVILAAAIASCLFSGQQWINFVWPFQVQFPMVYCAAIASLFALWKAAQPESRRDAWVAVTIAAAAISTYSMVNGVLLWPVLLLAALWLRMPRRSMAAIAAGTLLFGVAYFYHFHRAIVPVHQGDAERPARVAIFFLAQMGSPLSPLAMMCKTEKARLAAATIPGGLLALTLLAAFVMLWRRRDLYNNARALLLFYCVFLAATSASIAYGRSEDSPFDAFTSKYLTPPYLLWASLLLVAWPLLRRAPRVALYGVLCATILLAVAIHQKDMLVTVRERHAIEHLGELAIVNNVTDPEPWEWLFHPPEWSLDTIDFLRNNHLTIFTEEWTHWPGVPLNRRFFIDHTRDACQGEFEEALRVSSPLKAGWRVTGWAWDNKAGRSPRYIVLADEDQLVAGVALTGFPVPPVFATLQSHYVASTWTGYVSNPPRPITAYVVEADERSLCAIGTRKLSAAGSEAAFKDLGPLLPVSGPKITGNIVPKGYYEGGSATGPGAPPIEGPVYGSYPDSNTGSIHLGPFHLDGQTEMAIPLVTGPDTHDLSIVVRDVASREVYARLAPMPVRVNWWAWHPDLPLDRDITVEVFAQDNGSKWGQWLALGWPHILEKRQ